MSGDDAETPGAWEFWVHPLRSPGTSPYVKLLAVVEHATLDNANDVMDLDEGDARATCYIAAARLAPIMGVGAEAVGLIEASVPDRLRSLLTRAPGSERKAG